MSGRGRDGLRFLRVHVIRVGRCVRSCAPAVMLAAVLLAVVSIGAMPTYAGGTAPFTWDQLSPTPAPSSRMAANMAYDQATGTVLLFGGYDGTNYLNDTWSWNGSGWTELSPKTVPPARRNAATVYDPATGQLLMFGGQGSSGILDDTWVWSNGNWSQLHPSTSPPARENASIAYDAATGNVVLFGGWNGTSALGQNTWIWDGTDWVQERVSGPGARYGAAMAYDPATQTVVMFGGGNGSGDLNDTWVWNGTAWSQQSPANQPSTRDSASMAYDPAADAMVLFGGYSTTSGGPVNDTWTWDGSDWTQVSTATSPSAREDAPMAYDPGTQDLLLFGGEGPNSSIVGGTWSLVMNNPPHLTSVSPASGSVGTAVTLSGSGFGTVAGAVYFEQGGTTVQQTGSSVTWSDTSITTTVPSGLSAGSVSTSVYNDSTGLLSNTQTFTVLGPPASIMESLTPSRTTAGGSVTVSGVVYDANTDPIPGVTVDLSDSGAGGRFSSAAPVTSADGSFTATYTAPTTAGAYPITATAVGTNPAITASATLTAINTGVTVTGDSAGSTNSSSTPATAGGVNSNTPDTFATASGGTGSVTVEDYSGNPGPAPTFRSTGTYFDVSVSPGSTFTVVTVTQCGVSGSDALYWLNGTTWTAVSPDAAFDSNTGCLTFTAQASGTSPTIAELTGTPFAVASTFVPSGGGGGTVPAPAPTVTAISPDSGPASGGTSVTITGTGFTAPATVDFGPNNRATNVTVASSTEIIATSPAGSGTVDVTVTTSGETSPTSKADEFTYTPTPIVTPPVTFSDVPSSYWAYAAIEALAAKGIVNGFPDGTFRPGSTVTRAEFVKMLVLTLGLKPGTGDTSFTDVAPSDWFAPYVSTAVQAGIVRGLSATTFGPDEAMTREQMAVLLARALKLTQTTTLQFKDNATIDSWALQGVEEAVAGGYIDGFSDGTFEPLGTTTRAQAAKVLALVLSQETQASGGGSTSSSSSGSVSGS